MVMLSEFITYYTSKEGSVWIPWANTFRDIMPPQEWLDEQIAQKNPKGTGKIIEIRGQTLFGNRFYLPIHSFKTSKGREWDCINGWRQILGAKNEPTTKKD